MQSSSERLHVAVVNFHAAYGDKKVNLAKMEQMTEEAAYMGAQLVLFPELCLTGYEFYDDPDVDMETKRALAETADGEACRRMAKIAGKYGIYAIFGMPEADSENTGIIYNAAAVVGPAGMVGTYRKIHPYGRENLWCKKGNSPFMFPTPWGPVAVGVCYDTYSFPELMRHYAYKGARLYLNPTAIVRETETSFAQGYQTYLNCGVLSNQFFIASANLTGTEKKCTFGGGSVVVGPSAPSSGMVYSAVYGGSIDCATEGIYGAAIDLSLAKRTIYTVNPYTGEPDYRPDLYRTFQ